MARKSAHGELNWHKAQRRWYRKIRGPEGGYTTKYFGSAGKSPADRLCKKAALAEYAAFTKQRDTEARVQATLNRVKGIAEGILPVSDLGESAFEQAMLLDWKRKGLVTQDGYVSQIFLDPDARDPDNDEDWEGDDDDHSAFSADIGATRREQLRRDQKRRQAFYARIEARRPRKPQGRTIQDHADAWLAAETLRQHAGEISETAIRDKRVSIKGFTDFANGAAFGNAAKVDDLLTGYRKSLLRSTLKPNSVNDRLKFVKQLVMWCYTNNVLKEMPRQLPAFSKKLHTEKSGKPLTVDQVRALWGAAGPRMKCFMALGLNCGFKNGDITSLTGGMLQGGRLVGIREKTRKLRVPMNYPLWPLTRTLIKQQRDRTGLDELLFVNRAGGRIHTGSFSSLFKKVAAKAGVAATFEQLRDTAVRDVEQAIFQAGADVSLLQVFLAHKDRSTARYYLSDDPARLRVPALDVIVLGLEQVYGLK